MTTNGLESIPVPKFNYDKRNSLIPRNLGEAMELAKVMANSDIVPNEFRKKPENILIAIQLGAEVGLAPMQALQNIYVVNGKPAMWGDAVLGLIKGSGLLEDFEETFDEKAQKATCRSRRKDNKSDVIRIFGLEDAKKAGLWGKQGPWTNYPNRMLQMRARSWNLRDNFPDVLKGLNVREEVQDFDQIKEADVIQMPQRKSAPMQTQPAEPEAPISEKIETAVEMPTETIPAPVADKPDETSIPKNRVSRTPMKPMVSQFAGKCHECGEAISKGEMIFYDASIKKAFCHPACEYLPE